MKPKAKKVPEYLKSAVIYQIFLRPFTLEGNLKSATKMLPHLAELGVDILYLCPHTVADDDMNREHWSDRQKKSEMGNPRSPYRLKDYFMTDPEYGTDQDLKDFIRQAHELGLRVILDLVYFHCGPTANIINIDPEFVCRDKDGNVEMGYWHFPKINFESRKLREYLYSNMEYFVKEFDVDGYRCDAEDLIPLDFWEEGRPRLEALKPDIFMLAESERTDGQLKAYDANYGFSLPSKIGTVLRSESPATVLVDYFNELTDKAPEGALYIRGVDNHDISSDAYEERFERTLGMKAMNAGYFLNFTLDGIPFIYNGNEIADDARHSIFSSRSIDKTYIIDWSKAMTPAGQQRLEFMCDLIEMRHSQPALANGVRSWIETDAPDSVIAFRRVCEEQRIAVVINMHDKPLRVNVKLASEHLLEPDVIMLESADFKYENGDLKADLLPYGFFIVQY